MNIPDEAVEAAARAITARYGDPAKRWKQDVDDARAALEAAAPLLMAHAWQEGVAYALPGTQHGLDTFETLRPANPYWPTA